MISTSFSNKNLYKYPSFSQTYRMEEKIKHIVRVASTDLEGAKSIQRSLQKVKGISHAFSNALCIVLDLDHKQITGTLKKEQIDKLEDAIKHPLKYNIPEWMLNRRKDYTSGETKHLTQIDLKLQKEFDIKRLRKIKSYKGFRHGAGLPVRGQRTRGHFRKAGKAMGVQRKKKGKKG